MASVHVDSVKKLGDRQGWFDKGEANPNNPYTKNCVRGFPIIVNTGAEAHHLLPKVSFDRSLDGYNSSEIELIQKWAWVTPWNINNTNNMYGLPKLAAFVYAYSKDKADATTMSQTVKKNKKLSQSVIDWFAKGAAQSSVDEYCVHTPTTWGHDPFYNGDVAESLKGLWRDLAKDKNIHNETDAAKGTNASAIAAKLVALEGEMLALVKGRGALGTKKDWMDTADPKWYKKFTLHKDADPL